MNLGTLSAIEMYSVIKVFICQTDWNKTDTALTPENPEQPLGKKPLLPSVPFHIHQSFVHQQVKKRQVISIKL